MGGWAQSALLRSFLQAPSSLRPLDGGTASAPALATGRSGAEATVSLPCLVAVAWGAQLHSRNRSLVRRRNREKKYIHNKRYIDKQWSTEEEFYKLQRLTDLPPKPPRIRNAPGNEL